MVQVGHRERFVFVLDFTDPVEGSALTSKPPRDWWSVC